MKVERNNSIIHVEGLTRAPEERQNVTKHRETLKKDVKQRLRRQRLKGKSHRKGKGGTLERLGVLT